MTDAVMTAFRPQAGEIWKKIIAYEIHIQLIIRIIEMIFM